MISYKSYPYTDRLGWSYSRYNQFSSCKRKYFYNYYNKWCDNTKLAKRLKYLTSRHLELGKIVHRGLKLILTKAISSEDPVDIEKLETWLNREIQSSLRDSNWFEKYYNVEEVDLESYVHDNAMEMFKTFLESDRYKELKEMVYEKGQFTLIDPKGYGELRLNDNKIYAKVDFCFATPEDLLIIDWKTGKDDPKHVEQLSVYVAATLSMYPETVKPNKIEAVAAYLRDGYSELSIDSQTEQDIQDTIDLINHQTEEMEKYLKDIDSNIPLDISEFPKHSNKRFCKHCRFKEICLT